MHVALLWFTQVGKSAATGGRHRPNRSELIPGRTIVALDEQAVGRQEDAARYAGSRTIGERVIGRQVILVVGIQRPRRQDVGDRRAVAVRGGGRAFLVTHDGEGRPAQRP